MKSPQTNMQIIGSLMQHPQYFSETDKYNLTARDFTEQLERYIFVALYNLYQGGVTKISPIDIETYLLSNQHASSLFQKNNGLEYLKDAEDLSIYTNFPYYYNKLKKINLLNELKRNGIDTSQFYIEDLLNVNADATNARFEELTIADILNGVKQKLLYVERDFTQNEVTKTQTAVEGIESIIENAKEKNDVGYPIQGDLFNIVSAGARKSTLYIRSGSSGVSKTRQAVGDACYLAYPIRYNNIRCGWDNVGSSQKVLFIATEQTHEEIKKMILAYITGFNEEKFRYGNFSKEDIIIIKQAIWLMEQYKDNFYIVTMPNPTTELIKSIVRENVLLYDVEYVFYDYIFIGPALLNEFRGFNLRNDEVLLIMATTLKDLAVELGIFIMTSTQVNANADDNKNIRNESSIAGARAIINKADLGCVMARPTKEELEILGKLSVYPNIVTDIYKVRSGRWNQIRIWSFVDLGNLRKTDLFVTDSRLDTIPMLEESVRIELNDEVDQNAINQTLRYLNEANWN